MMRTLPVGWELWKDRGQITLNHRGIAWSFYDDGEGVHGFVYGFLADFIEQAQETEQEKDGTTFTEERVRSLFSLSGFEVLGVWEIRNKYWPDHPRYDSVRSPWWLVKTSIGMIEIGWRKRVIQIDWSDTDFNIIVTEDDVTKDIKYVHAYGYAKAVEYLTRLRERSGAKSCFDQAAA